MPLWLISNWKLVLVGILALVIAGMAGTIAIQHANAKALEAEKAGLEKTVSEQSQVITAQKESIERIQRLNTELAVANAAAQKEVDDLKKRIGDSIKIDAEILKKPKELQDKLNNIMKSTLRCNEIATGSAVTNDDKVNTVCPNLVKAGGKK